MIPEPSPKEQLKAIGYRVSDCAGLALGLDLLITERGGFNEELFERAISGMSSVLEERLKLLANDIDVWAIDHAKDEPDANRQP